MKQYVAICLFFVFSFLGQTLLAQTIFQASYANPAGLSALKGGILNAAGELVYAGHALRTNAGADLLLIKFNQQGGVIWAKTYGGSSNDYGFCVVQTTDGGYAIGGQTQSFGAGSEDVLIIKTDADGNLQWSKVFGNSSSNKIISNRSIIQTSDGNIVFAALCEMGGGIASYANFVTKLNSTTGATVWSNIYHIITTGADWARDVIEVENGNILVSGASGTSSQANVTDCALLKLNSAGSVLWCKTWGGTDSDIFANAILLPDGNYLATGHARSFNNGTLDVIWLKVTPDGTPIWNRILKGTSNERDGDTKELSDGSFIHTTYTQSFGPGYQAIFNRLDATGQIIGSRTFGGANDDYGQSIIATPDNGFVISGSTNSYGGNSTENVFLLKTDLTGSIAGCPATTQNPPNGIANLSEEVQTPSVSVSLLAVTTPNLVINSITFTPNIICSVTQTACTDPQTAFTANTACTGQTTVFNNTSTGLDAGATFAWDVDNNGVTDYTTQNPTHVYPAAGTFSVKLTVTNPGGCDSTIIKTVSVIQAPTATITATNTTLCLGQSTTLTAGGGVSYLWTPTGQPGATLNITPSVGAQTFTLTATGLNNCTDTETITITVNPSPTLNIQTQDVNVCPNQIAQLVATGAVSYVWNPGNVIGDTLNVLPPATTTYTVTGTDANGCTASSTLQVVVQPLPNVNITAPKVNLCPGESVTLTASGANNFQWQNGPATATYTVLPTQDSTAYIVTGSNALGCVQKDTIIIRVVHEGAVGVSSKPTLCPGESATITVAGGSLPGYTYSWQGLPPGITHVVTPSATTDYILTVNTPSGCTVIDTLRVFVNPTLSIIAIPPQGFICPGGSLDLKAFGAETYVWYPDTVAGAQITVSPPQTTIYTVVGSVAAGCTGSTTVTVTVIDSLAVTVSASDTLVCQGQLTTLHAFAPGANSYEWLTIPPKFGEYISETPNVTTTYTVHVTTPGGCEAFDSITIRVLPSPQANTGGSQRFVCTGSSTQLGGSPEPGIRYLWSPTTYLDNPYIANPVTTPAANTFYTLTAVAQSGANLIVNGDFSAGTTGFTSQYALSPNNLSANNTYNVAADPSTQNPAFSSCGDHTSGSGNMLIANGSANANISIWCQTVNVEKGTDYMFSAWVANAANTSPAKLLFVINGFPLGVSTQTGLNACEWNQQAVFWNSATDSVANLCIIQQGTFPSGNDYLIDDIELFPACIAQGSVNVQLVNPLNPVATTTTPSLCKGQTATLKASGGSINYTWSPGTFSGSANGDSVTVVVDSTTTFTVTSNNACGPATATVTVVAKGAPTVSATASSLSVCLGETIDLTGSGADVYLWQPGNFVTPVLNIAINQTTTYTLIGQNINGTTVCGADTTTITVSVVTNPTLVVTGAQLSLCLGQGTQLTASGVSSYLWLPTNETTPTITITPSVTTTYTVIGTASCGTASQTVTVDVTPPPPITVSSSGAIVCDGTPLSLTAVGADSYLWLPDSLTGATVSVSPSAATTYTVVGDINGCTNTTTITLQHSPLPTITASASQTFVCPNQNITLSATGGVSYVWQPGNLVGQTVTASAASTTTFTVTGTNPVGCTNTATILITTPNLPVMTATASPSTICEGGSTTLTGANSPTYLWNHSGETTQSVVVSPTVTTTYTLTGVDSCGSKTTTVTVNVIPKPILNVTASRDTVCLSGLVTLKATGADFYQWQPGNLSGSTVIVNVDAQTTFTVTGTRNSCSNTTTFTVFVAQLPVVEATTSDGNLCHGESATMTATGALSYLWQPGNLTGAVVTVTPPTTTIYTVVGKNAAGCEDTAMIALLGFTPFSVRAEAVDHALCLGESTTLRAALSNIVGLTYVWNPGNVSGQSIDVSPTQTTVYTMSGTDINGCRQSDTVTVFVEKLIVEIKNDDQKICRIDQTQALEANANLRMGTYEWQKSMDTTANQWQTVLFTNSSVYLPNPAPDSVTYYRVVGVSTQGCADTSNTVAIDFTYRPPVAAFTTQPTPADSSFVIVYLRDSVHFINQSTDPSPNSSGQLTYFWQLGKGFTSREESPYKEYWLIGTDTVTLYATNEAGCVDSASMRVVTVASCLPEIPNAFSPNNDDRNNEWPFEAIRNYDAFYEGATIDVYDRWGIPVYHFPKDGRVWNGFIHNSPNRPTHEQVFVYVARCYNPEFGFIEKVGTVTVLR